MPGWKQGEQGGHQRPWETWVGTLESSTESLVSISFCVSLRAGGAGAGSSSSGVGGGCTASGAKTVRRTRHPAQRANDVRPAAANWESNTQQDVESGLQCGKPVSVSPLRKGR